jgi:hypothetical protein
MSVRKTGKDKDKGEASAERKERLATELRANLKRRKARLRGGQDTTAGISKQPD